MSMIRTYLVALILLIATACGSNDRGRDEHANHAGAVDHNTMGHSAQEGMDHSTMKSSPDAANAPIELQFIDTMIVHHQGAIDMAKLADTRAGRAEVNKLAVSIGLEQTGEIVTMKELRSRWFGEKSEAINMEFPGMSAGMRGMDMTKLSGLKGDDFDVEFVRQMIPHHEGAIEMARHIRSQDSYAELKQLADHIIKAQEAEIRQMREWLSIWEKR